MELIEKVSALRNNSIALKKLTTTLTSKNFAGSWLFERRLQPQHFRIPEAGARIELAKYCSAGPDVYFARRTHKSSWYWIDSMARRISINTAKAVVVISHDRAFVDNITTRTIEVTMGRIYDYKAKYSHYLELRKKTWTTAKAVRWTTKMIARNHWIYRTLQRHILKTLQSTIEG